jgi:hypothetical protein
LKAELAQCEKRKWAHAWGAIIKGNTPSVNTCAGS